MAKELLTDVTLRNAKATEKDQRLNDGSGLYLLIKPNGAKWWRFDYRFNEERKTLSLGTYPATSLSDARRKANEARSQIENDTNPSDLRKQAKLEIKRQAENDKRINAGLPIINSFEHVASEWLASIAHAVRSTTHQKKVNRFGLHVYPIIGESCTLQLVTNRTNMPILDLRLQQLPD